MSYSVTPILHPYADKNSLHKINIQVIYNKMKVYKPTIIKVPENNFDKGVIVRHANKTKFNLVLKEICHEIEKNLIDAIHGGTVMTKERLERIVKGEKEPEESSTKIFDYMSDLQGELRGKLSKGRLKHYKVIAGKVEDFQPGATFKQVSVSWLQKFEAWLRKVGIDGNTVLSNMSLLIGVLNKAAVVGLVRKNQFEGYKRPKYDQKMSEYLTEDEIEKLFSLVKAIEKPSYKLAGYYYLLSCFTGYRISDAKAFDYEKNLQDGSLVLRATKNKAIVSTPIFPRLQEILDYIKDRPLDLSEEKIRKYLKDMFLLAGIKKDISYHSSRHTYSIMLMNKGFTVDEVSELIGDSKLITQVYAKVSNVNLSKKIMDKFG